MREITTGKYLRLSIAPALLFVAILVGSPLAQEFQEPRVVEMKLIQCVEAALKNNREILIERMSARAAESDVERAWSDFDPFLTSDASVNHVRRPSGTILLGADVSEQETLQLNVGVGARVPSGGLLRLDFQNERTESNSYFQELNPQYSTALVFSVSQPLLKNFGTTPNLYRVRLAKNNRAVSELALQGVILQTISRVEEAYWQLVLAMDNLEVQRMSLRLADEVLEMTRAQVRTGVLPPIATLQAEASRASREEGVIVAENAVDTTQRNLQNVINIQPGTGPVFILPVDRPARVQPIDDLDKIIEEAIQNNYQLKQLEFQLHNAGLLRQLSRNQSLPRLDLVASVGMLGLSGDAGDPVTQLIQTGRVIPDPTGTSLGILETTTVSGGDNPFDGSYYDSLDSMVSGDYYTWSVGIQLQYPLGNRAARIDYSQAMIEEQKLALQVENTRKLIEMAIYNLAAELLTNIKRVNATHTASELSRQNMEAEKKKFSVGISTNRDVLQAQETYAMALMAEIQARIDYNTTLGRLERARMGFLDVTGGVSLPSLTSGAGVPASISLPSGLTGESLQSLPSGLGSLPAGMSLPF